MSHCIHSPVTGAGKATKNSGQVHLPSNRSNIGGRTLPPWASWDCTKEVWRAYTPTAKIKGILWRENLKSHKRTTLSKLPPFKRRQISLNRLCRRGLGKKGHTGTLKVSNIPSHKSSQGKAVTQDPPLCLLNGWDPNIPVSPQWWAGLWDAWEQRLVSPFPLLDRSSSNICSETVAYFKIPNCKQVDWMIMCAST